MLYFSFWRINAFVSWLSRVSLALLFVVSVSQPAEAAQPSEQDKIAYLLEAVGSSNLVFIRNGLEYSGADARKHLQRKLDYLRSRIHTVDDFINFVASKSSVTGIPYYVKFADGTRLEASVWLRDKLARMN
jgi:hypothetical protein